MGLSAGWTGNLASRPRRRSDCQSDLRLHMTWVGRTSRSVSVRSQRRASLTLARMSVSARLTAPIFTHGRARNRDFSGIAQAASVMPHLAGYCSAGGVSITATDACHGQKASLSNPQPWPCARRREARRAANQQCGVHAAFVATPDASESQDGSRWFGGPCHFFGNARTSPREMRVTVRFLRSE